MKIIYEICLIAALCKLKSIQGSLGNLVFYGRGQGGLPFLWNELGYTKHSDDSFVFFPSESSNGNTVTKNRANDDITENDKEETNIVEGDSIETDTTEPNSTENNVDRTRNFPLVMFLPGVKNKDDYSYLDFHVGTKQTIANLYDYHKIKSELKILPPSIKTLKKLGYKCIDFELSCNDLDEVTIDQIKDKWMENVDIQLYLESDEGNKIYRNDIIKKRELHYKIKNFTSPTTEWNECTGSIIQSEFQEKKIVYTDFVFRNYGIMPVYIFVGNTMFLKKDPNEVLKNGAIEKNYHNWSWTQNNDMYTNQVFEGDPEQKECLRFESESEGGFGFYFNIINRFLGPPEAVSFKIRAMNDYQLSLKLDNLKIFNITSDYLIHRNCKIPLKKEITFLIDLRSLVYSDSKNLLSNNIKGFWLQSISNINDIKERLREINGDEVADAYKEIVYLYDFTIHNTYPENPNNGEYYKEKLDKNGEECSLKLETHEDWGDEKRINNANPVIQWPDDVIYETADDEKSNNNDKPEENNNNNDIPEENNNSNDIPEENNNNNDIPEENVNDNNETDTNKSNNDNQKDNQENDRGDNKSTENNINHISEQGLNAEGNNSNIIKPMNTLYLLIIVTLFLL